MAFFVAIHQQAKPERVGDLLAVIRANLDAVLQLHPGRRSTQVYQLLDRPEQILSLATWESQSAFDVFRQSPSFVTAAESWSVSIQVEELEQPRRLDHMARRSRVLGCAIFTSPPERAADVEAYLLDERHLEIDRAAGLASHAVYRSRARPGRILSTHSWESLTDLEGFRVSDTPRVLNGLVAFGATMERFTGVLAAEYSAFAR